jgi:hypothetical protein
VSLAPPAASAVVAAVPGAVVGGAVIAGAEVASVICRVLPRVSVAAPSTRALIRSWLRISRPATARS